MLQIMKTSPARRATLDGRGMIFFDFTGDPHAKTNGLAEDASKKITGTVWVGEGDRQARRLIAVFHDNFSVGFGLAAVAKGSSFTFDQKLVNNELWLPTSTSSARLWASLATAERSRSTIATINAFIPKRNRSTEVDGRRLILGIESSCDETAAAVVAGGRRTLSSVVASQIGIHAPYGGVVPELASREHLRNIVPVVRAALAQARVSLPELDAVAVTEGPGLAGALLVGVTYAKTLAWALGKPLVAVNHLEGHIHAVLLEHAAQDASAAATTAPALALVVSGGHTHLYVAAPEVTREGSGRWQYQVVGHTVDDAAGEAFDKVAKLLGLPYPGGPWIDGLAPHGDARAVPFRFAEVRRREGRQRASTVSADAPELMFSFSGIKTGVLRYVENHGLGPACAARARALGAIEKPTLTDALALCDAETLGLIASFQRAVVDNLVGRTLAAARRYGARTVLVSGGVAANRELRACFEQQTAREGLTVLFPSLALSTDNAAMIAAAAWPRLQAGLLAPDSLEANPRLRLGVESGC